MGKELEEAKLLGGREQSVLPLFRKLKKSHKGEALAHLNDNKTVTIINSGACLRKT